MQIQEIEFGKLFFIQKEKQHQQTEQKLANIQEQFTQMHQILIQCTINPSNQMNQIKELYKIVNSIKLHAETEIEERALEYEEYIAKRDELEQEQFEQNYQQIESSDEDENEDQSNEHENSNEDFYLQEEINSFYQNTIEQITELAWVLIENQKQISKVLLERLIDLIVVDIPLNHIEQPLAVGILIFNSIAQNMSINPEINQICLEGVQQIIEEKLYQFKLELIPYSLIAGITKYYQLFHLEEKLLENYEETQNQEQQQMESQQQQQLSSEQSITQNNNNNIDNLETSVLVQMMF